MTLQTFTVIYRTGGTENAKWQRALPVPTIEEAREQAASIKRGGRKALVAKTAYWDSIGLPEGW